MSQLVPNRFLFSFEFALRYRSTLPPVDGNMSGWTDDDTLPDLGELDGQRSFATVRACWSEAGIAVACEVTGKRRPPHCDPDAYWKSDVLRLCLDMRDTRTIRRATKFCQQFYFMPQGGGPLGKSPTGGCVPLKRAREDAPAINPGDLKVASRVHATGYELEAMIPAHCLSGFDPQEHPRIGFYYIVEDRDLGQQHLTVGDDLFWYTDPSTWATAVLTESG